MNPERIVEKLRANPTKSLDAARRGSLQDLSELANFWQEVPQLLSLGILGVFFGHLHPSKAPGSPDPSAAGTTNARKAFMALVGLTKAGNFIGEGQGLTEEIIQAWPGLFKWSAFFFAVRVNPPNISPEMRRSTIDVISGSWYSICRDDAVRRTIVSTPGSIEVAVHLWLLEDAGTIPSIIDLPSCSAALDTILKVADSTTFDRVVKAAGGKADKVAQVALKRYRTMMSKPLTNGIPPSIYADVMVQFSRSPEHTLRHALLSANAITTITKGLVSVSEQINRTNNPTLLEVMVASFCYLYNCLESTDGFTWITHSVQAGLLTAFVDCSPYYSKLDAEDFEMILIIFKRIVPRYLVYRSVIDAVDNGMKKVQTQLQRDRVQKSPAADVWQEFYALARERLMVTIHASAMKGRGATCDNVKCNKIDTKKNFSRCAACCTTLYCSKECQATAWKEGDHKTMCKMKQRERFEGKKQSISRKDGAFFHHLSTRDARRHLPMLRGLAGKYPNVDLEDLLIQIDYTTLPETYNVKPIAEHSGPTTSGPDAIEARHDALLQKAKDNPGKYTLVESTISNGQAKQLVRTLVTGSFWDGDEDLVGGSGRVQGVPYSGEYSDEYDEALDNGVALDEVDMMKVSSVLRSFGLDM